MKILGIIPARYASTRFPAKALADIGGKSMIGRVYEQAKKATSLSHVIVATDHHEILDHVRSWGGDAYMTNPHHASGTDRCFEALTLQGISYDYVVNIQGDEPFIQPDQINLLSHLLNGVTEIATLAKRIDDVETLFNPNVVKVVVNKNHQALYFSRSTIPYIRTATQENWISQHVFLKHIGLYAYRTDILKQLTELPVSVLEKAESLEQLRWLENGFRISVIQTNTETIGIDTPEDLHKALNYLKQ